MDDTTLWVVLSVCTLLCVGLALVYLYEPSHQHEEPTETVALSGHVTYDARFVRSDDYGTDSGTN